MWLDYAPFNNTYALAANADTIAKYGDIATLSDLAKVNNDGQAPGMCVESEFSVRNDGLPGMAAGVRHRLQLRPDQRARHGRDLPGDRRRHVRVRRGVHHRRPDRRSST